ncbi:hypothetical protein CGRA01v4_00447 [Colletotrichum graminicola]|nr:hypothetical protein CGRA01v4_00447 [Colletotrichum graminicola]
MLTQTALTSGSEPHNTIPTYILTWGSLPAELRQMILELLARQTSGWGACASVCKEWKATLEKESFRQLKLQQTCLADMETMIDARKARLIKHIWLNIKLRPYTCRSCQFAESYSWFCSNNRLAKQAIVKLFSILSCWPVKEGADLTLELSIQSPSDKEHFFKNLYFGDEDDDLTFDWSRRQPHDSHSKRLFHDSRHGWENGRQINDPDTSAIRRIFEPLDFKIREDLPRVNAVTRFILRRQCRRQIEPQLLGSLFDKLPRLQSLIYEPWQSWDSFAQGYLNLVESHLPHTVKKISVFEDTNEKYITLFQPGSDTVRVTSPAVSAAFAKRSLGLEQLSVAFMVDASDFFQSCQQDWIWINMRSLTLTSRLTQRESHKVMRLLNSAAKTALSIPHLHTLVMWNSYKGEAFKFFYHVKSNSTRIGWRGTWDLKLGSDTIRNWQMVADKYTRYNLEVISEPLISTVVNSRAYAIELLDLPAEVVHPVSLLQIRGEIDLSWFKE